MINYIRGIVSGRKKRFIDRKYNLDLSYITPRILAMAFPANGWETVYRNSIDEISQFWKERHDSNFLVINLSGKSYDKKKFSGKVLEFNWVDHHAPPLNLLFIICEQIHRFLLEKEANVVVINCRAGKGRTGTIVCCYWLFSGRWTHPVDCFNYYSKKRFSHGEGVTQPSQKKYVEYFSMMLQKKIYFPYIRTIKAITWKDFSKNSNGNFRPYFEFYQKNSDKICLTTKTSYIEQKSVQIVDNKAVITEPYFSYFWCGDLTINIYNNGLLSAQKLGRISFNTAFLTKDQVEKSFKIDEIDPDNWIKNKAIPKSYQIWITFGKMCDCNNWEFPINLCPACNKYFSENSSELKDWEEVRQILKLYTPMKNKDEVSKRAWKTWWFGKWYWDDIDIVLNEGKKISGQQWINIDTAYNSNTFHNYRDNSVGFKDVSAYPCGLFLTRGLSNDFHTPKTNNYCISNNLLGIVGNDINEEIYNSHDNKDVDSYDSENDNSSSDSQDSEEENENELNEDDEFNSSFEGECRLI